MVAIKVIGFCRFILAARWGAGRIIPFTHDLCLLSDVFAEKAIRLEFIKTDGFFL